MGQQVAVSPQIYTAVRILKSQILPVTPVEIFYSDAGNQTISANHGQTSNQAESLASKPTVHHPGDKMTHPLIRISYYSSSRRLPPKLGGHTGTKMTAVGISRASIYFHRYIYGNLHPAKHPLGGVDIAMSFSRKLQTLISRFFVSRSS